MTCDTPTGEVVGKSVARLDGPEKVTGKALYTDDLSRPGMLYGCILGSSVPHARLVSVDTSAAKALKGVRAVITGADLPNKLTGTYLKDQLVLARDKVRYIGDPIAAVAAVDAEVARAALRLIDVQYEELPAVFDPREALAPDAPILHEERGTYVAMYPKPEHPNAASMTSFEDGDPDAAWAECDVIVEGEFELPSQQHMYLEPVSTLAEVDANGKLTLWSSMQGVARVQALVAESLEIPMSKIRAIAPRVGGGFGGKCELSNQAVVAALALATGRPVKMTLSRDEDMIMMKRRHGGTIFMKTGARRDGTLVARSVEIHLEGGAYADETPGVAAFAAYMSRGPYRIPHARVRAWGVYTNRSRAGAFRGFGNPQVSFASESQVDEIAGRLGIDPLELRRRNALASGDAWLGGHAVDVGSLEACLEKLGSACEWDRRCKANGSIRAGRRRGIGMAAVAHTSAFLSAGATVRLNEDGTIVVNTGAQDIGQGADTSLAQIAAGALGLPLEHVNYANPDTDSSPYNFQSSGSRITYMVGNAVLEACRRVKEQIFRHASEIFKCPQDDIELRPGGLVGIKGAADACLPFAAIAGRALFASGGPISGSHDWIYPAKAFDPERTTVQGFNFNQSLGVFTFGAQAVEVEVDELTGQVEILEVWAVHDVGRAINPAMVEGQIEGGIVQGLGYALLEELVWEEGRLVNPSMMDYKVPAMTDVPPKIHPYILEVAAADAPFGAKGVAEIGIVAPAPAVANAVYAATGVRLKRIPATPERVLRALMALDRDSIEKSRSAAASPPRVRTNSPAEV